MLLDIGSDYFVTSLANLTLFQQFNVNDTSLIQTIQLDNKRISYGSPNVVCTYDNANNNLCLFNNTQKEVGPMCAH